ncbi:hypothetical protein LWI29_029822 [Acer saccharum]|uniref:Uncharacterized protein n=1 Tax=Acer saccharum TaxID=4024 RepID=A0AA39VLA2_ACESA|nr:hypothetical protein LWI29_029822 [Acer saccharum]
MEVTIQSFVAFGFPFTVDGEAVFEANYFFKKMEELVEELGLALKVFDESPERNKCESILLWNVLINGCCKVGDLGKEYVYNRLQFSYGWYFTFVQGFVYLSLIYLQGSLAFLNYPEQLMFKSIKVLPVMIMGAFIPGLRRKYRPHK